LTQLLLFFFFLRPLSTTNRLLLAVCSELVLFQHIGSRRTVMALELHYSFTTLTEHRQTYPFPLIRTNMKAQHETTIQFSGYPLAIVDERPSSAKPELTVIKRANDTVRSSPKDSITNDPDKWDIDWFNSYE
jgi:hypothetical protein